MPIASLVASHVESLKVRRCVTVGEEEEREEEGVGAFPGRRAFAETLILRVYKGGEFRGGSLDYSSVFC